MRKILEKVFVGVVIAFGLMVFATQNAEAHWSWHKGWLHNQKGSSCDKGSKGSSDKGSSDKGSKGSSYSNIPNNTPTPNNTPKTGTICGFIFHDNNQNATQDPGEGGFGNIGIKITDNQNTIHTVVSDINGSYCIQNIPGGSAVVDIDLQTLPLNSIVTTDNPTAINVIPGTSNFAGKDGIFNGAGTPVAPSPVAPSPVAPSPVAPSPFIP
jgi:hypothetical protein